MKNSVFSRRATIAITLAAIAIPVGGAVAQQGPDRKGIVEAQVRSMDDLSWMDGEWRGVASIADGKGGWREITQTERIGPMLGGSIKVIEGRGYEADGTTSFNAFAVLSYDPDRKAYTMRSYNDGMVGDFPLELTADGYTWEIPAGPMKIVYTASLTDGTWMETGHRVMPDGESTKFVEMKLKRISDSDWPVSGAVALK